jgi:antitoxin PrlF
MELARLTSKGQMTIPKRVRDAAHLKTGDVLMLTVQGDRVLLRKLPSSDTAYLRSIQSTFDEWNTPEDEAAWRDL